jgi:molecular chaperone DnaK (HSP70)
MMRYFPFLAVAAIAFLVPAAHAREQEDFHEKARHAVERTDNDLQKFVHRDNLNDGQREKFDAAMKDLKEFREDAAAGKWEGGRERLERAIGNIESVVKNAPIGEQERQTLEIDLYTLRDIRDGWR